ncbi:hypothetical protein [Pseudonocardia sp. ICBG601]
MLLGCADPRTDPAFRGATVGRFANRIDGGRSSSTAPSTS